MRVVLITGCRSGIGLATALAFARRGDRVYACVRNAAVDGGLQKSAAQEGLDIRVVELDVTDGASVTRIVADVVAAEDRLDVMVNNAGIAGSISSIEEIEEETARAVFETNFWASFRLLRAVLPQMRKQRSGVIVNLSSFGAQLPGGPGLALYGLSKAALSRLSESLHAELTGTGVRVVAIEPGFFATEIYRDDTRPRLDPSSPYHDLIRSADARVASGIKGGADPAIVAAAIVSASVEADTPTRVLVGDDAVQAVDAYRRSLLAQ